MADGEDDGDRHDGAGEQHGVAQRDEGEDVVADGVGGDVGIHQPSFLSTIVRHPSSRSRRVIS